MITGQRYTDTPFSVPLRHGRNDEQRDDRIRIRISVLRWIRADLLCALAILFGIAISRRRRLEGSQTESTSCRHLFDHRNSTNAVAAKAYTEVDLRIGRFATRNGRIIQLHPSGITLQVPQDWLEWDAQFQNNFHLSHRELRSVRVGHGEWDSEYGSVVNASLPFEHSDRESSHARR